MVPPLAQIHLLGRAPHLLSFRSVRLACCDALSATLGRLLYRSRHPLLPLYTDTVVRCVISPAATALRLFHGVYHPSKRWQLPHAKHRGAYQAVTLRLSEVLAALTLQWAFWSHVRLHRHSQAAVLGE